MAVILKVASTAKELDDVYKLRYEVFVNEDKKFLNANLTDERIFDKFDAIPEVANIIAYSDEGAIATIRLNKSTGFSLPAEELYDFSTYKSELVEKEENTPIITSAGMLAIRSKWRGRRDVLQAMFKLSIGVARHWGVTHGIAAVNKDTVTMYTKLGYVELDEPIWVESIGNFIVPMASEFAPVFQWAFGHLIGGRIDDFWFDSFSAHFERVILSANELLFSQGDVANDAYLIDNGWVNIVRSGFDDSELQIASLSRGTLFGELALIDDGPRSATAVASGRVELIRINRDVFEQVISRDNDKLKRLLSIFAHRLRETDEQAMVMAFAPQTKRVKFALDKLRNDSVPDKKVEGSRVIKCGPADLAKTAGVRESEVLGVLEAEKAGGHLDYSTSLIRFFGEHWLHG